AESVFLLDLGAELLEARRDRRLRVVAERDRLGSARRFEAREDREAPAHRVRVAGIAAGAGAASAARAARSAGSAAEAATRAAARRTPEPTRASERHGRPDAAASVAAARARAAARGRSGRAHAPGHSDRRAV